MRIPTRARTTDREWPCDWWGAEEGGGGALCGGVRRWHKLLYFTLNISGFRSDFPHLHTEIPCLLRPFPAFRRICTGRVRCARLFGHACDTTWIGFGSIFIALRMRKKCLDQSGVRSVTWQRNLVRQGQL